MCVCARVCTNACDQGGKKILLQIMNEIIIDIPFIPVLVKRKDGFYSCICVSLDSANTHTEGFFFCIPKITKWEMKTGEGERELLRMIFS